MCLTGQIVLILSPVAAANSSTDSREFSSLWYHTFENKNSGFRHMNEFKQDLQKLKVPKFLKRRKITESERRREIPQAS